MSVLRRRLMLLIVTAVAMGLGLLAFGFASAADPVTVALTSTTEGTVVIVNVAVTNNTADNLSLDIKGVLPAGAKFVDASPQGGYKFMGDFVYWAGRVSPNGKTGYQYKFQVNTGTASAVVSYIGSTRGTVTAQLAVSGPATFAQAAVPTKAPVAQLDIVPVPGDLAFAHAIKASMPGTTTTVALSTSGLPNVSVGVPVVLMGSAADEASPAKTFAWTLSKPSASKAALDKADAQIAKFTPDVVGTYKVDLIVGNEAGKSPMVSVQIDSAKYVGVETGNCKQCHPGKVSEWLGTGHATKLQREIDGSADPKNSKYNEGCIRCHTVGYAPGAENGGFAELQVKTGWKFPTADSIKSGTANNWAAIPADLKKVSNIQCENCHGPASQHVTKGSPMAKSLDAGVCNACHGAGGSHTRNQEWENSAHSDANATAWNYPTGPTRQACVRCHSGNGFISFLENPTEQASWDNTPQTVTCGVCHDSHSDANKRQLRITGKPVLANGVTKDFALSAICTECHNGRTPASEAANAATPHYSAAAEILSNTGGVDYGKQIIDSPHGSIVGAGPVKDASGKDLFGGNTPGACVACHMYPKPADAKDPNRFKVGSHSFNMVSPDGFEYTAACQQCHPGIKTFADVKAKSDYDGNGTNQSAQAEVAGLMKIVQKAINDSGIKATESHPYFDQTNKANWSASQKNAIFNYLFVRGLPGTDGKASAIHNFKRSVTLLQLSYKDLTGKDVPNATLMQ